MILRDAMPSYWQSVSRRRRPGRPGLADAARRRVPRARPTSCCTTTWPARELLTHARAGCRADLPRPPRPRPALVAGRNQRRDDPPRARRPHRRAAQRRRSARSSPALAEELAALEAAGVPYEIVPGVTAAQAASSHAGIPLTHRDDASCVAFVTGQECGDKQPPTRSTTPPSPNSPARSCSTWASRRRRSGAARSSTTANRRRRRSPSCGAARCPIRKRFSRRSANSATWCERPNCGRRRS